MDLDSPIILIGAQRSGTTWLGDAFSRHPRLAYWEEPRHVWTWGNGYKPDDRLTAADARPRVARHIRGTFAAYVRRHGGDCLAEKTPSNCLRIPFIRAVYPRARMLLVIRDGRSVIRSTSRMLETGVPTRRILKRAAETPIWEWPAYAGRAVGTLVRKATGRGLRFWGPRPPGWREWLERDHPDVVLAKQWNSTIRIALADAADQPPDLIHRFRYEDLLARPREVFRGIVDFLQLPDADDLIDYVEHSANESRAHAWREELDPGTLERIRPHMEPALEMIGYKW